MDRTKSADTRFRRLAVRLFAPAASVVVVAVGLVGWHVGSRLMEPDWLRAARSAHTEWSETGALEHARRLQTAEFLGGLRAVGAAPHLPDLTGAGFTIQQVSVVGSRGERGASLHVGYRSPEPCFLTLWISDADGDLPLPPEYRRGGGATWRAGRLNYAFVGPALRREFFHVISEIAYRVTVAGAGPTSRAETILRMSAMLGPRCGGNSMG